MDNFYWGYIEGFDDANEELFYARILGEDGWQETFSFNILIVDPDDNDKLQLGSIFRWYYDNPKKDLEFPTIMWTKEQLDDAEMRAEELWKYFNDEDCSTG